MATNVAIGTAPLHSIAQVLMGQSPSSNYVGDAIDGLPFLQGNAEFGERHPVSRLRCSAPGRVCDSGDILLSVRAPVGEANQADQPYAIGRGLCAIRFHGVPAAYGWHALRHSVELLRRVAQGSTFEAVSRADVERLEVPYWPDERPRLIAAVLDAVDDSIAKAEAVIAKSRLVHRGLVDQLLTCGCDDAGAIRDVHDDASFRTSEIGRIPAKWDVLRVDQVGEVRLGRQRSPAHERGQHMRPYLRVANVFDGFIDYSDVLTMNFTPAEQASYELKPGDILLNEGQSLELVGRCAIYDGPAGTMCFQNTLVRFRCGPAVIPAFCRLIYKRWLDRGFFARIARQTTSVAHLGADRFAAMPFPRPPLPEQRDICNRAAAGTEAIDAAAAEFEKLTLLRRGLQHDLLSGRVRVDEGV